jgi:natural product biosynthesis luciferase-like monooxygenase protein
LDFGLFYFADDVRTGTDQYRLLLEGAKFADTHGFSAVWTPERHFHQFGGRYPNPAVTAAAIAAVTERIAIRAGSVVAPLHHPARIAEEWAVVDNLSGGRVGISFAPGWHLVDFALRPENYAGRRQDRHRTAPVAAGDGGAGRRGGRAGQDSDLSGPGPAGPADVDHQLGQP